MQLGQISLSKITLPSQFNSRYNDRQVHWNVGDCQ